MEADRDHSCFISECMKRIGETNSILIKGDVFRFIKSCHQQFDLIFADPPYALEKLGELPQLIFDGNLLKPGGVFVLEHGKNYDFSSAERFLEHRHYGSVNFSLFR